jgi:hypothetical protein
LVQVGCQLARIDAPQSGQVVSGAAPVIGSAQIRDFSFYKVEYQPRSGPGGWRALSTTYSMPVVEGRLDTWYTDGLPPGAYDLKLTVVDLRAQEVCTWLVGDIVVAGPGTEGLTVTLTPTVTDTAIPTLPGTVPTAADTSLGGGDRQPGAVATPVPGQAVPAQGAQSGLEPLEPRHWLQMFTLGFLGAVVAFLVVGAIVVLRREL